MLGRLKEVPVSRGSAVPFISHNLALSSHTYKHRNERVWSKVRVQFVLPFLLYQQACLIEAESKGGPLYKVRPVLTQTMLNC